MTPEQRQRIIEILQAEQDLDPEWARVLFPPSRRESELVYYGKERSEDILAETMGVPLQAVRTFGRNGNGWSNKLVFGDNLQAMKTLVELKRQGKLRSADGTPGVRLAYIDPPFATKREFRGSQEQKAYQDKIAGVEFLEFLRKRIILIRELLADDGVLFVHTDWKKGHYIKILLDEIFGESRFRNEIVWWYYNKMQGNINRFPSNHETIFFYSAGTTFPFSALMEERAERSRLLKRAWDKKTKRLVNVKGRDGKVVYIDVEDKRVDDVWRLSMLQPADRSENVGYPTQKPETLLALVLEAASNSGDLIMDCFAGSGTTLAVAEKLGRRWIGIDCGKLALYTMQKRLLNLRSEIGNKKGQHINPKPFTLYNAGLYDFSRLRDLPWTDWRFFALQLFQCKDQPHRISGIDLDGLYRGAPVLVFNHFKDPGARVTHETIDDLHDALGRKIGARFFIIAPALSFAFQEDYVDRNGTRYYALRIPYSIINELHRRDFTAIRQPADEAEVNDTVESVGFDFIRTPEAKISYSSRVGDAAEQLVRIKITTFKSEVVTRTPPLENLASLSTLMLDVNYDGEVFDLDTVAFADQLKANNYTIDIPAETLGERIMLVLIDVHGNEFREVKTRQELGFSPIGKTATPTRARAARSSSAQKSSARPAPRGRKRPTHRPRKAHAARR